MKLIFIRLLVPMLLNVLNFLRLFIAFILLVDAFGGFGIFNCADVFEFLYTFDYHALTFVSDHWFAAFSLLSF